MLNALVQITHCILYKHHTHKTEEEEEEEDTASGAAGVRWGVVEWRRRLSEGDELSKVIEQVSRCYSKGRRFTRQV